MPMPRASAMLRPAGPEATRPPVSAMPGAFRPAPRSPAGSGVPAGWCAAPTATRRARGALPTDACRRRSARAAAWPTASRMPFAVRNAAAAVGLAKSTRNGCSKARPRSPTGADATRISQARRWSSVSMRRWMTLTHKPRTRRTHSLQKNRIRAVAVATCSPTTNARYGDSGEASWATSFAQEPPMSAGTRTVWPRLETGNSSVTPWTIPMTMAWRNVNSSAPRRVVEPARA